jgi:DNA-binding transcriptional MerR regulator
MEALHQLAHSNPYWSLEEFAMVANQWLPRVLPEAKANTRVREEVNPRLIRQYTTWGLVDVPYKEGREARYAYRHLLQLLVTRRLLAEGYGTAVIHKLMAGQDDGALEAMLSGGTQVTMAAEPPANPAMAFLQGLTRSRSASSPPSKSAAAPPPPPAQAPAPAPSAPAAAKKLAAPSYESAKEARRSDIEEAAPLFDLYEEAEAAAYAPPVSFPQRWLRLEIVPGFELHVRDDFRFPAHDADRQALLDEIARQLDDNQPT